MDQKIEVLNVKIASPKQILYSGPASSVSSINSAGKFDILPEHANFVTMTKDSPIIIVTPEGKTLTFDLPVTIIYNRNNNTRIYTDITSFKTPDK